MVWLWKASGINCKLDLVCWLKVMGILRIAKKKKFNLIVCSIKNKTKSGDGACLHLRNQGTSIVVPGQPELHRQTLSQNQNNQINLGLDLELYIIINYYTWLNTALSPGRIRTASEGTGGRGMGGRPGTTGRRDTAHTHVTQRYKWGYPGRKGRRWEAGGKRRWRGGRIRAKCNDIRTKMS